MTQRLHLVFLASALLALAGCKTDEAATGGDPLAAPAATQNIVETAMAAGDFNTLTKALQAAGLVDTLAGVGPFTVFAPTDAAFDKIDAAALQALLADPEKLASVLTYHVVPGRLMAADVVEQTSVDTVQGSAADIQVADGTVMIGNATVIKTDIACSNGVIHVIDTVIMPN